MSPELQLPPGEGQESAQYRPAGRDAPAGSLYRLAKGICQAVPVAASASVVLLDESGRPTTTVATDETSSHLDSAQLDQVAGPGLDAWRHRRVVRVDDVRQAFELYPGFSAAALSSGILSSLSVPILVAGTSVGTLSLYAETSHGFGVDEEALVADFATVATTLLSLAEAYSDTVAEVNGLREAMRFRATIEQAKGIVMAASADMGPHEAFRHLVAISQRDNLQLRDVAKRIVQDRRSQPAPVGSIGAPSPPSSPAT